MNPKSEPEEIQHDYLSTGCLHGRHAYCASTTGMQGAKRPATCKFCGAHCRCSCRGSDTMSAETNQKGRTMKPSVGRIVHYVSHGTPVRTDGTQAHSSTCRAAIITAVHGPGVEPGSLAASDMWDVDLCVLNPEGLFFNRHCIQVETDHSGGTWHWPEREPDEGAAPLAGNGAG